MLLHNGISVSGFFDVIVVVLMVNLIYIVKSNLTIEFIVENIRSANCGNLHTKTRIEMFIF